MRAHSLNTRNPNVYQKHKLTQKGPDLLTELNSGNLFNKKKITKFIAILLICNLKNKFIYKIHYEHKKKFIGKAPKDDDHNSD